MALEQCDDADAASWIHAATSIPGREQTIAALVPVGFQSYVQIRHAVHLEPDVSSMQGMDWALPSATGQEVDRLLAQFGAALPSGATMRSRSGGSIGERRGVRLRWSELARSLRVSLGELATFTDLWDAISGDWPDAIDGPVEGSLAWSECVALTQLLDAFAQEQVTFWYTWANTQDWAARCDVGALEDVLEYFDLEGVHGTPEYWWPSDRSWLICTDYDLTYTIFAGPTAAAEALMTDGRLECAPVNPEWKLR